MNLGSSQFQYFPSKIFQAGINWTMPITQTDGGWVSHDDILSDTQIQEKTFTGKFYRQTFPEKFNYSPTCVLCILLPELIFGATGATGGRVKFLSAV